MARRKIGDKKGTGKKNRAASEQVNNVQADEYSIAFKELHVGGDVGGDIRIGHTIGYTADQVSVLLKQITTTLEPKKFDGRCPYKGLEVFEEEDAELFFGRERLVNELVGRVKESRTVFITGPSGSGKSSLVRAGLIHALKQGAIKSSDRWLYETMKPGREPIKDLALAFSRLKSPELQDYFLTHVSETDILNKCAESVLSGRKDQRFLLFVDQFEEVFTQINSEDERIAFINMLSHAGTVENGRMIILFAMRSDFVSNCATYPLLNELLSQEFRQIGAMQPEELVNAIALPAMHVGLPVENELIAQIINDMKGEPDALPLMQFALKDLFDAKQADGGIIALTLKDYLGHGGIHKSLERHADATFAKLSESEQELTRSIFSGLIEIGRGTQDTKRTALFDELVPANVKTEDVETIVRKLADARLIITDEQAGKDTVTISHEKLIEAWPWLKKLVNENRDAIALQNEIASDAKEWEDHKQDASYLYTGARLANAREKLETKKLILGGLAQFFVDSGTEIEKTRRREEEKQRQKELDDARKLADAEAQRAESEKQRAEEQTRSTLKLRQFTRYLSIAFIAALIGVAVAVFFGFQSQQQAKIALARQLVAQAQSIDANGEANGESRQMIAVLLAVQSTRLLPSVEAQQILQTNSLAHVIAHVVHNGAVNSVAFSPDGKYVVSGSSDKTASVWEAATGREVAHITHDGIVYSVSFSPDGRYVASASCDEFVNGCTKGSVRVWEAITGREIARMIYGNVVDSVDFSPDGKYVISGSLDKTVRVWEAFTGKEIARVTHDAAVFSVAFSPDGRYVMSGSGDKTARIWEAFTGREIARITHDSSVNSVAFSPDGRYVVSGDSDATVRVSETSTGREIARMRQVGVISVDFSPDGQYVVSGGWDYTARVWEAFTGKEIARMEMGGGVEFVTFSPDSKYVAAGGCGNGGEKDCGVGIARVWEVATGKEIAHIIRKDTISSASFSPDGKHIVSGSWDNRVDIWEATSGREIFRMAYQGYLYTSAFSRDGKYVVSASCDEYKNSTCTKSSAHVWQMTAGKEIVSMINYGIALPGPFSPDDKYLVSTTCDAYDKYICIKSSIRVWEASTGREVAHMAQDGAGPAVAFSPDSKYVVSGSCDEYDKEYTCIKGGTHLWQVTTGSEITHLTYNGYVRNVTFSPDGKYVVSTNCDEYLRGCKSGSAHVWEASTGREIARLIHDDDVNSVDFSPNSKYVVSGGYDGTARVWEVSTGHEIARMTHDDAVFSVAFSPDGKYVVSGGLDKTARVWEASTGREIARLTHDDSVFSVVFSPDGKYVMSIGNDKTGFVWEAATGRKIAYISYDINGAAASIAFSEDGKSVVSTTGGIVNVWLYSPQDLIDYACSIVTRNLTRAEWKQYIGDAMEYEAICPNLPIEPVPTKTAAP